MLECRPETGDPQCTVCKTCASVCPVEVDLEYLIPRYRYLFSPRTSHRGIFQTVGKMLTYTKVKGWIVDVDTDEDSDVIYFPGCAPLFDLLLDRGTNYAGGSKAAVKVLNKMGIKPKILYGCCGHDQHYAGMLDEEELMKKQLKDDLDAAKGKTIVTGCAECYHQLKNNHGVDNVVFFTDFIKENRDKLELSGEKKLKTTYHDPCRLGRHNNLYDSPRDIIDEISEFNEMERNRDNAPCCGVSSWVNCNHESRKLRVERFKEAEGAGAEYIITTCPKCRIHLDCLNFDKLEKEDVPDMKLLDAQELIGMAAGVYDPFAEEESFQETQVRTDPPNVTPIEHDPERYLTDQVLRNIYICTTCNRCSEECHSSVNTAETVLEFRRKLFDMDRAPEVHKMALDNIRNLKNPFGEKPETRNEVLEGFDTKSSGAEVLLFTGCVPSLQDIRLIPALLKLFDAAGVDYSVQGSEESCCGFLAYLVGAMDDFKQCVDINRDNFEKTGAKTIVTPCAGCFRTLSELYPKHTEFPYRVVHTTEYLLELVKEGKLSFEKPQDKKVAYHDPCDLGRHCGVYEPPRELMAAVPDLEIVEFAANREKANCCGGGGGLKGFENDLSLETAYRRMKEGADAGAELVVSACPTCKDNLSLGASRLKKEGGPKIKVWDLVELLAKSLG